MVQTGGGRSGVRVKTSLVLFVEDDESVRELFGAALRSAGLAVEEVTCVSDAVEIAVRVRPDLVILDRDLLDGDGWDVARAMRRLDGTKTIPILAFTSHKLRGDIEAALVAGCDAFLAKPCSTELLVNHVLGLLGLPLVAFSRSS